MTAKQDIKPDEINAEYFVPTDVETTGLTPWKGDLLLQINVRVVEPFTPYIEVAEPVEWVVKHDPAFAFNQANEYVQQMHENTGLWAQLAHGTPLEQVDEELRAYLEEHVAQHKGMIFGNSVRLDANFIDYYLPRTSEWLHYRLVDVSTLAIYARHEFDVPKFVKNGSHRPDEDIRESLAEAQFITDELARTAHLGRSL